MTSTTLADNFIAELAQESQATRRMLERVPEDNLGWKPHEKSMSVGRLATHVAELPDWGRNIVESDALDMAASDFVLSHVVHHRGQLSVYLRLLEIPVPGSYGPTADEQGGME